jgi:hypothetical protein
VVHTCVVDFAFLLPSRVWIYWLYMQKLKFISYVLCLYLLSEWRMLWSLLFFIIAIISHMCLCLQGFLWICVKASIRTKIPRIFLDLQGNCRLYFILDLCYCLVLNLRSILTFQSPIGKFKCIFWINKGKAIEAL